MFRQTLTSSEGFKNPSEEANVWRNMLRQQDKTLKENHYAATVIQRTYRGYAARKLYKKHIHAVIVLQKFTRRWLVRFHLPEKLHEYWDNVCHEKYVKAAIRLQAAWRGKLVRNEVDVRKIMEKRRTDANNMLHGVDIDFGAERREKEAKQLLDDDDPSAGSPLGQDRLLKAKILDMMFDRHHLLSTKVQKGVLKCSSELKEIEKILKSLSWKDYMKNVKKIYYKYRKIEQDLKTTTYMFEDKNMRRQEDLLRLRDKSQDAKEECLGKCTADNRKPFDLYSKPQRTYQRTLMGEEEYTGRQTTIRRTEDKSKNISDKDFICTLKQIVKECKIPNYYADFWYKECIGHHFCE